MQIDAKQEDYAGIDNECQDESAPIFRFDRKVALVIGCSSYAKQRENEGKDFPKDIPETMEDVKVVCAGLKKLKFSDQNIRVLIDPDFSDISLALKEINLEIEKLFKEKGIHTLLFSYFAGHGVMD